MADILDVGSKLFNYFCITTHPDAPNQVLSQSVPNLERVVENVKS